jgi:type III restriction enzyme
MTNIKNLYESVKEEAYDYGFVKPEPPKYITNNLKYEFFKWQKNAFENFLTFQAIKERKNPNKPTHLMFNMATGTGKTLLMASAILYYYEKGYSHFIFFVNQNNIVDKTENNFIDKTHSKYLYKDKIVIDDKTIAIKKVETFSDNPQGIEIKFTTIQKLYNDIHLERENQTTLEDLHNKHIIMLADEAHHLNADTKSKNGIQQELIPTKITSKTSETEIERKGWEHTVIELILNKNGTKEENWNVLLEFTATIPANEKVAEKYEDKIIYKFGLKEFLSAGYTKEINLISSTLDKKERILQALLFQWYRHKIALKNGIANFKPVILFRSKMIEESKADYKEFLNWTENITRKDFDFLENIANRIYEAKQPTLFEQGKSRTEQVLDFIRKENISYSEISEFIKSNFTKNNVIITNSKMNKTKTEKTTEEQERLLNNLEDKNNHIRAIFTVDRLTEGWDVLNLFDIVRLYQGQNAGGSTKKTPEATTKEKQLIGRGVRYFPFTHKDKIKNKRKFDDDLKNELRILEELYYYTYDEESRYISHLKKELKKDGYIRDDKIIKTFSLKKDFQKSDFYKNTKVWYNKQKDNPNRKKKSLEYIKNNFSFEYKIQGLEMYEQELELSKKIDLQRLNLQESNLHIISIKFKDIEKHIFRKAINIKAKQENSLFQFKELKEELEIETIDDLQKDEFLGDFNLKITVNRLIVYDNIKGEDKLNITLKFLENIFTELKISITPKIGSLKFYPSSFEKIFGEPKIKAINKNNLDDSIAKNNEWYVLDGFVGTSEERGLIEFIKETIGNLEEKYNEIYLLRNEEVYKIYDFDRGRGFQPDFILFLKNKNKINMYYQIFIEPKGNEYVGDNKTFKKGKESWKETFLEQISEKYGFQNIIKAETINYRLIGLPFFNKDHNMNFKEKYQVIIN